MKLIRFFFFAIVMIAFSLTLNAQSPTATIRGTVTDSKNEPIISVMVQIRGTTMGVVTDIDGKYELKVPIGSHVAVAKSMLYQTQEVEVRVTAGKKYDIDFILEENATALAEIAVEGRTPVQQLRETPFNVTAVEAKKLHNMSADMNQVLNRTTGVRIRESGGMGSDFTFSLNGFSGKQVKFFLDGMPIDNYGPSFTLNNLPVNLAERIEVYKGVVPVHLGGDALGGAINIVTNKRMSKYVDVSYSVGSFNTHKASINARFAEKNGLVVNFNTFGNYSDNSYKVDAEIIDKSVSGKYLESRKYKRFHDGYKSGTAMLEVGLQGKSYADYLLFGMAVTGNKDEIQEGSTMDKVIGEAFKDSRSLIPSVKYKKTNLFIDGLSFDISASYNIAHRNVVDTCSRVYDWDKSYVYRSDNNQTKGELGDKKLLKFDEKNLTTTSNLSYQIHPMHSFNLNHSYSNFTRKEDDLYKEINNNKLGGKPRISKHILGLGYNLKALDEKLSFSAFGKMYSLYSKMKSDDKMLSSSKDEWGYGFAAAYHIIPQLQAKMSYEHAYRLPTDLEMLGDGAIVVSNLDINPESSDNLNLGLTFSKNLSSLHYLNIEGNFIYRRADDFIRDVAKGPSEIQYVNEKSVKIIGLDGVVRYAYSNWIQFETNVTWQRTTNVSKQSTYEMESENYYYGEQIPNTPIFYMNADLSFLFHNLIKKEDNLTLTVGTNYTASFYLDWAKLGDKSQKKGIPEQFTQNAAVAYSLAKNKYNVSFECQNITNKKVYDYFLVQRPGRSFNVKFRYFFSN